MYTTDVLLSDLDQDGDLDIVWANQPGPDGSGIEGDVEIDRNLGGGVFERAPQPGLDGIGSWTFVRAGDLDQDGDPDLVLTRPAASRTQLLLLLNDGAGRLAPAPEPAPVVMAETDGLVYGRAAIGDVDGDGTLDLLVPTFHDVAGAADTANALFLDQGGAVFVRDDTGRMPTLEAGTDFTLSASIGELTGDGHADVILGEAERQQRLLVNDGSGHFRDESTDDGAGRPRLPPDPVRAYHIELRDLDADGDLDVVAADDASVSSGTPVALGNHLLRNDGEGRFAFEELPRSGPARDARGLDVGDVDKDGVLDIVIGNATETLPHGGTAIEVLLGRPDGGYESLPRVPSFEAGVFGVAVGDVDGDGRSDVVAAVNEPSSSGDLSNILLLAR
jgi:hypothetical protein